MNSYETIRSWTDIEACECEKINGVFLVHQEPDPTLPGDTYIRRLCALIAGSLTAHKFSYLIHIRDNLFVAAAESSKG